MEDFSNFITEEIFILGDAPKNDSDSGMTETSDHKLGIITGDISAEENDLLNKILFALNLVESDILRAEKIDKKKCAKWLIFADSYEMGSDSLEFYKPSRNQGNTFLLAQPLFTLRESQEEKKKLWTAIKTLFGI